MIWILLFFLGAAMGSFIDLVASRYEPDKFLLSFGTIRGRSICNYCKKKLQWYELIPIVSYVIQRGRCRACKIKISLEYPLSEILSGLIFVFVSLHFFTLHTPHPIILSILWILALLTLLVIALVDIRLTLIPDEANIFLGLIGILLAATYGAHSPFWEHSFVGHYALLLGGELTEWVSRFFGALSGALFFGALIVFSKGRGMGMGDMKLAVALGMLFGFPDVLFAVALSFILGSVVGIFMILRGRNTMKGFLPFGPFLALGAALVFFFGFPIVRAYFALLGV